MPLASSDQHKYFVLWLHCSILSLRCALGLLSFWVSFCELFSECVHLVSLYTLDDSMQWCTVHVISPVFKPELQFALHTQLSLCIAAPLCAIAACQMHRAHTPCCYLHCAHTFCIVHYAHTSCIVHIHCALCTY